MTLASHTLLPHAVPGSPVVVDLGANRGEFYTALATCFHPLRYLAVEPDKGLAEQLRVNPRIEVMNVAIAERDATIPFVIDKNPEASRISTLTDANAVQVQGTTLATLFDRANIDSVDLLKIDIEGAECPMLLQTAASVLRRVRQITVEFHDFCGLNTANEVRQTLHRLHSLGFTGIRFSLDNSNWCFLRSEMTHDRRAFIAKNVTARLRRFSHLIHSLRSNRVCLAS